MLSVQELQCNLYCGPHVRSNETTELSEYGYVKQGTQGCNLHDDGAHVLETHPLTFVFHGPLAWSQFATRGDDKQEYWALTGTTHDWTEPFVPFQFLSMLGPGFFRSLYDGKFTNRLKLWMACEEMMESIMENSCYH